MLACTGCGVKLQYEAKEEIGYLSKHKVDEHFKR